MFDTGRCNWCSWLFLFTAITPFVCRFLRIPAVLKFPVFYLAVPLIDRCRRRCRLFRRQRYRDCRWLTSPRKRSPYVRRTLDGCLFWASPPPPPAVSLSVALHTWLCQKRESTRHDDESASLLVVPIVLFLLPLACACAVQP